MADEFEISISVDEDEVMRGLDAQAERDKRFIKNLLDNVSTHGLHALESYVPRYTTYLFRHTDRSSVRWHPGGAGGGGEYEAIVGIKAGTSNHPMYVSRGTGEYGLYKRPYGPVTASHMVFFSHIYGRVIRLTSVRGQKPNPFLEETYVDMRLYLHSQLISGQIGL